MSNLRAAARRWKLRIVELRIEGVRSPLAICTNRRGERVVLKTSPTDASVLREAAVLSELAKLGPAGFSVPLLRAVDERESIIAIDWIAHELRKKASPAALGSALGSLHASTFDRPERFARFEDARPGESLADSVVWTSPEFYAGMSHASIELFGEIQRSHPALASLRELAYERVEHARCLIHRDFRHPNVLVPTDGGPPVLIDWELAAWGDPARDVGSYFAEELAAPLTVSDRVPQAVRHRCRSFFRAYLRERRKRFPIEAGFARRAIRWMGSALIHFIYAKTHYERTFDADDLQLTRSLCRALHSPREFADSLSAA